jgi:hypothetical protein
MVCSGTALPHHQVLIGQVSLFNIFWSHPTLDDIKALFGVVINMGLHPMSDITDYFPPSWLNKLPFFSDVFAKDKFLLLFYNLHFAHTEGQGKQKKEHLINSVLKIIRSKCIKHY